jgi:hypothetical protein
MVKVVPLDVTFQSKLCMEKVKEIILHLCGPYRCVITKFGSCLLSNTTRQYIITNTLYGQHVSAIAICHHQASHRKKTVLVLRGMR